MKCPSCDGPAFYTRLADGKLEITCLDASHPVVAPVDMSPRLRARILDLMKNYPLAQRKTTKETT